MAATIPSPFPTCTAEQREGPARCCSLSKSMANGSPFAKVDTAAPTTTLPQTYRSSAAQSSPMYPVLGSIMERKTRMFSSCSSTDRFGVPLDANP